MRKILLVVAVLLFLGAACGDDSSSTAASSTTEGSTTTTAASGPPPVALTGDVNNHGTGDATGGAIDMEQDNFYFGPTFVKATAGATITVHLTNNGSAPHTFTIDALSIDEELQPGDTADVEVTLPASGATAFYCKFHKGQGMQGAIFFNEGDTVNT